MPVMPDLFREAEEAVFGRRHRAASAAPQAPAPAPATMKPAPRRRTMQIATDLHDLADVLARVPDEALSALRAIGANKAALDLLLTLGKVAAPAVGVDPAIFTALKTMLEPYTPPAPAQAAQAPAPAQQQGQAQTAAAG